MALLAVFHGVVQAIPDGGDVFIDFGEVVLLIVLDVTGDRGDPGSRHRGPLEVQVLELDIPFFIVVSRQVADETVGLHHAGLVPFALEIIAVQGLGQLGLGSQTLVEAFAVPIKLHAAAPGVAAAASRHSRHLGVPGRGKGEGCEVDLISAFVVLFPQLAKRGRSELAHHAVGQYPGLLLGKVVLDAVPALLEVISFSNLVIVVADAAGLARAVRLVGILSGEGIDDLIVVGLEVERGTGLDLGAHHRRCQPHPSPTSTSSQNTKKRKPLLAISAPENR